MIRRLAPLIERLKLAFRWVSVPPRFVAALLSLAVVISFASWALLDQRNAYALVFPRLDGRGFGAERRELPRVFGRELRAERIAEEVLLGPVDPRFAAAFPRGVSVRSVLLREGRLYIDLSEDAALVDPLELRQGLESLERSLQLGVRGFKACVITIGGQEPYRS